MNGSVVAALDYWSEGWELKYQHHQAGPTGLLSKANLNVNANTFKYHWFDGIIQRLKKMYGSFGDMITKEVGISQKPNNSTKHTIHPTTNPQ